jgi:hypothetical protein
MFMLCESDITFRTPVRIYFYLEKPVLEYLCQIKESRSDIASTQNLLINFKPIICKLNCSHVIKRFINELYLGCQPIRKDIIWSNVIIYNYQPCKSVIWRIVSQRKIMSLEGGINFRGETIYKKHIAERVVEQIVTPRKF